MEPADYEQMSPVYVRDYELLNPEAKGQFWKEKNYPTWDLLLRRDVGDLPEPYLSEAFKNKPAGWPDFMP